MHLLQAVRQFLISSFADKRQRKAGPKCRERTNTRGRVTSRGAQMPASEVCHGEGGRHSSSSPGEGTRQRGESFVLLTNPNQTAQTRRNLWGPTDGRASWGVSTRASMTPNL